MLNNGKKLWWLPRDLFNWKFVSKVVCLYWDIGVSDIFRLNINEKYNLHTWLNSSIRKVYLQLITHAALREWFYSRLF